jgi:hypothetical protein
MGLERALAVLGVVADVWGAVPDGPRRPPPPEDDDIGGVGVGRMEGIAVLRGVLGFFGDFASMTGAGACLGAALDRSIFGGRKGKGRFGAMVVGIG